jgi:hypothetical protein
VSSSPSSSFLRSGGTCPHGVTRRMQAISNARFCPLAATELTHCMYRDSDSSPSHCYYQQVACCPYSPNAKHVFRLATRNKAWHYMFCFICSNRYFPYILRLCTRNTVFFLPSYCMKFFHCLKHKCSLNDKNFNCFS